MKENETVNLDKIVELLLSPRERKIGYSMLRYLDDEEVIKVLCMCGKMQVDQWNIIGRCMFTAGMHARGDTFWDTAELRVSFAKGQLLRNNPPGMDARQILIDRSVKTIELYDISVL
jgi:hypothetical protein